jgi:hypothetical protein
MKEISQMAGFLGVSAHVKLLGLVESHRCSPSVWHQIRILDQMERADMSNRSSLLQLNTSQGSRLSRVGRLLRFGYLSYPLPSPYPHSASYTRLPFHARLGPHALLHQSCPGRALFSSVFSCYPFVDRDLYSLLCIRDAGSNAAHFRFDVDPFHGVPGFAFY